jgi:Zinc carboxypeptidase
MKKISASVLIALTMLCSLNAQLKSPEEFLGYKIGSRYTPHWKVVNYFNHVAANTATTMKLDKYGETNEGRPLLVSFISSAENIQQLEAIRLNNLRLANRAKDKMAVNENAPAIVWLSYNVHGNETSSSEAAMLTLYALVDPANTETKEWLKNTVVIIDPCINPDGRDRYVNWFNSIAGKIANPRLDAREHRELWPGGRTNHYNFDLNRDWAWQTQVETQQRIKVYEQWLPQIHVDYHEQGVNEPYYFAPAAQPYHEVITKWQRDFQTTIGKNNAKYFDKNNWLFFTKEVFDLLYPSYGDTYPIYNGAIGMTYEQGGGPGGGLAAQTDDNDTLTLYDRAMHHYTTSLSTIEIASLNAGKLIKEFRNFFNEAVTAGIGEYKTYIIKDEPGNGQRMKSFRQLLEKNNIQYGTATVSGRGFNYQTGKEESFSTAAGDVVVSALQPKSALVKVLLEPVSKLVDSVTYDITAWSLPYAYGLKAYAVKEKINPTAFDAAKSTNEAKEAYGYVIKWEGVSSVKAAGQLMQKGILVRYAEQPFETGGQKFGRGSLIILKTSNKSQAADLWKTVADVCNENNITAYPVASGFVDKGYDFGSDKVRPLKVPKVALVTGEGVGSNAAGEIWHFFERQLDYPLTLINANDLARANWATIDVLIMPDGNYKFLNEKAQLDEFKNWVTKGGRVVALEGAVAQLAKAEMGIKLKKPDEEDDKKDKKDSEDGYDALKKFENRERDFIPNYTPGSIFKVDMDNTHPLAYGYPNFYYTLKMDDNIYEFIKGGGWNVGVIKKENQLAGFVGTKLKSKLKDGLLFGVQDMGRGAISYLADNVMFRSFWENGKLMFCNAVFLGGQ